MGVQFSGGGAYLDIKGGAYSDIKGGAYSDIKGGAYSDFLVFLGLDLNGSIVCLTMAFAIGLGPYPCLAAANALPGG